ncbi:hypothetical protein MUK70_25830 [Dyadobacter chenwenxiniae]|uniref:Uncharacterized protein n=1 Tax=Dyadobacter chenwenxiniae TaxID=2906456 RepID=A0A9X1PNF5_9BACT|nr:hypothetical protein [Dyadobacter chenwenxiniae]MCF0064350.1 hypothetical protein [Dyadobacter chenwenxiniae]UON82441.1 hypothetical protein MUK70_25830 [Dyadobacter chenwenxiniae]
MRRISLQFSVLLAALFLFAFSCQDHYVPEEPEPETLQIKTLPIESPTNGEYSRTKLGVAIEKLGIKPVKEFGLVISIHWIGDNDYTEQPTTSNQTLSIEEAPSLGEHTFTEGGFERDEIAEVYYRAYAELADGQVIYGEIMKFTPLDIVGIRVTDVSGKSAPISGTVDISSLGAVDVEEYGLVYSYKVNSNDPISSRPTLADHKAKSAIPIKLGKQEITLPTPGNSVSHLYVRPYVKYKNGNVFYGNISGH